MGKAARKVLQKEADSEDEKEGSDISSSSEDSADGMVCDCQCGHCEHMGNCRCGGKCHCKHCAKDCKLLPNLRGKHGATPLLEAAGGGGRDVVELLLQCGADANLRMSDGRTALMIAALAGDADTCELLMDGSWGPRGQTSRSHLCRGCK